MLTLSNHKTLKKELIKFEKQIKGTAAENLGKKIIQDVYNAVSRIDQIHEELALSKIDNEKIKENAEILNQLRIQMKKVIAELE